MSPPHRRTSRAAALGAFLVSLPVYGLTLHRGIPAGDSGELIAVVHTLGTAHPPGYPLWTLLAAGWERVLPLGSVAFRLNLLSAVCTALAAATLVYEYLALLPSEM